MTLDRQLNVVRGRPITAIARLAAPFHRSDRNNVCQVPTGQGLIFVLRHNIQSNARFVCPLWNNSWMQLMRLIEDMTRSLPSTVKWKTTARNNVLSSGLVSLTAA